METKTPYRTEEHIRVFEPVVTWRDLFLVTWEHVEELQKLVMEQRREIEQLHSELMQACRVIICQNEEKDT